MTRPLGVGVIGAGVISHAYLGSICRSADLRLVAISSRGMASAEAQARRYGGAAKPTEAILADPEVDIVVNLAPPAEHHPIGRAALLAGKHLYSEKPLATSLADARDVIALADSRGLTLGAAPDTFLGPAHQAARRLLDEGVIGPVVGGAAVMASNGMEHWHPNPAFFYAPGGGPLLDIGPYMITQLVNLLGPVRAVTAFGTAPRRTRTVLSPERAGETFQVNVPTTVNGALLFENGANIALTVSWDVVSHQRQAIELYGPAGTLSTVTPNNFDGEVRIGRGGGDWTIAHAGGGPAGPRDAREIVDALATLQKGLHPATGEPIGPDSPPLFGDLRGLGLVDLARAVREGRAPRAGAPLALHVLDVLLALEAGAEHGGAVQITDGVARPDALPAAPTQSGDPHD